MVKESTEKITRREENVAYRNIPQSDTLAPQSPGYLPIWLYREGFDRYEVLTESDVQDFLNMKIDASVIQRIKNAARN